jgi:hypothetical protein
MEESEKLAIFIAATILVDSTWLFHRAFRLASVYWWERGAIGLST